jgi:hypothetical protein
MTALLAQWESTPAHRTVLPLSREATTFFEARSAEWNKP